MSDSPHKRPLVGWIFRGTLMLAGVTLAIYIPYKYATQLHAISGLYAFLFPMSGLLAMAGIALAWKPTLGCSCGMPLRAGIGSISVLWLCTGLLCVSSLATGVMNDPVQGSIAVVHMVLQHILLTFGLLAFVLFPVRIVEWLGLEVPDKPPSDTPQPAYRSS
jgi:hypothetical protein